jgi:hypothetical protein
MKRFVEGADRGQSTLLPQCLDEWVEESNSVRVIDCFVDSLDLADLGFEGVEPAATGRPAYHPSVLLKLYIYGYLNRLLGRLAPDDKVIADFRKDNGRAIRKVCASFVNLCRQDAAGGDQAGEAAGRESTARESKKIDFVTRNIILRDKLIRGANIVIDANARSAFDEGFELQASCANPSQIEDYLQDTAGFLRPVDRASQKGDVGVIGLGIICIPGSVATNYNPLHLKPPRTGL